MKFVWQISYPLRMVRVRVIIYWQKFCYLPTRFARRGIKYLIFNGTIAFMWPSVTHWKGGQKMLKFVWCQLWMFPNSIFFPQTGPLYITQWKTWPGRLFEDYKEWYLCQRKKKYKNLKNCICAKVRNKDLPSWLRRTKWSTKLKILPQIHV